MNLRREQFQDIRVREAMNLAFDFENTNKTIMYDSYKRSKSYFDNGSLASYGLPEGDELAILEPYREQLPARLFVEEFSQPTSAQEGGMRPKLTQGIAFIEGGRLCAERRRDDP